MAKAKSSSLGIVLAVVVFVAALGIAGYSFTHSGDGGAARDKCIENLHEIAAWKEAWFQAHPDSQEPTKEDLLKTPGRTWPVCPSGGTYTIAAKGVPVHCSLGAELGHTF